MGGQSRYSRRMAHRMQLPLPAPNYGSVNCGRCGRMMPAINDRGAYVCTCGNADYANGAAAVAASAKR